MSNAASSGASGTWPIDHTAKGANHKREVHDGTASPGLCLEEKHDCSSYSTDGCKDRGGIDDEHSNGAHQWRARTCRICLEVVPPSWAMDDDSAADMPRSGNQPRYISQDPNSGRLLRPCKCKGSQRYVHEGCLQAWRHSDVSYGRRTFWECPTCRFRYRLERMRWSRWIGSPVSQVILTVFLLIFTVFLLGFVADPIISLYLDPINTLTTNPFKAGTRDFMVSNEDDETWAEHLFKGLASLGLLGAVKAFFAMSPWQWFNLRNSGVIAGGTRNGRALSGRDRLESISWSLVVIGVITFLWAVWKAVRSWSRKTLERASERVVDVQDDEDGDA